MERVDVELVADRGAGRPQRLARHLPAEEPPLGPAGAVDVAEGVGPGPLEVGKVGGPVDGRVPRAACPPARTASIATRSSASSRQSAAPALARTCSGDVAPAITDAIAGRPTSQANASSSRVWSRSAANASSRSTTSNWRSESAFARRSSGTPARRVPGGGGSPRRYLPVSTPLASGKYGSMPREWRSQAGSTSSSALRRRRLSSFWAVTNGV